MNKQEIHFEIRLVIDNLNKKDLLNVLNYANQIKNRKK